MRGHGRGGLCTKRRQPGLLAPGRPDVDPVLGWGRRLLADAGPWATLRLLDGATTTAGGLVASYQPTRTDGGHKH